MEGKQLFQTLNTYNKPVDEPKYVFPCVPAVVHKDPEALALPLSQPRSFSHYKETMVPLFLLISLKRIVATPSLPTDISVAMFAILLNLENSSLMDLVIIDV